MKKDARQIWFVTGTGTDVGKSVVAASLARAVHDAGLSVQAIKAVQTGCRDLPDGSREAPDPLLYAEACPGIVTQTLAAFVPACSPHLAARLEGAELSAAGLAAAIRRLAGEADITIVEGAGGLLVPLNERETMADLPALLDARVVAVAANVLGSINHVLLTLEALRLRGLAADRLVVTAPSPEPSDELERRIRADNLDVFRDNGRVACLCDLPHYSALAAGDPRTREAAWRDAAVRLAPLVKHLLATADAAETEAVADFDASHLWHPYAPTTPPPRNWVAEKTRGTRIVLDDGRELVDGMSSWWAAIHGYNHPGLVAALHRQAERMPHVMFGGLTHRPAAALGEKLLALAPAGLDRVFFCDSGSVAAEAAIKMAIQYQQARGRPGKCRLATPLGGYHGDTLGAMSVCDPVNGMHTLFSGVLARQLFFDRPACPFAGDFRPETLASVEQLFADHGDAIAAVILEPIVQGAGGMWFYHPDYLRRIRELCDNHGALLILDEIATGFGRTGRMFAAEWAGIAPDIMCVGKALTGGVMTLAAVLAREEVAATISRRGVFMHGPTFMANPLACAVAEASLDTLHASPWRERIGKLEQAMRRGLEPCRKLPGVADVRVLGGIGVVETERPVDAARLQRFFVDECGVWIRPFARLVYIMPPYVAVEAEVAALTGAITRAMEERRWE